jgi:hypothetical protein
MIQAKFRYKGESKWNYKDFNSEDEMIKCLEEDEKEIEEYNSRPKKLNNPIKNWFINLKNTKKNYQKVKGSPYASLIFALKVRKIIIGILIPFIAWRIWDMVMNFRGSGYMGTFTKLFMVGVGIYICWKIYETIPYAKKQIEYYKKNPHLINYVPTNTKETVDDIFKKIQENKTREDK